MPGKKKDIVSVEGVDPEMSGEMQMRVVENMLTAADDMSKWIDIRTRSRAFGVAFKPTPEDRVFVLWRVWAGHTQEDIARALDMETQTLRTHFSQELELGMQGLVTAATKTLAAKALAGDTQSLIFLLRMRGGEPWREKKEAPITVNVTPAEQRQFDPERVNAALAAVTEQVVKRLKKGEE